PDEQAFTPDPAVPRSGRTELRKPRPAPSDLSLLSVRSSLHHPQPPLLTRTPEPPIAAQWLLFARTPCARGRPARPRYDHPMAPWDVQDDGASELLAAVYDQLRAIAQERMSAENPGHTLQATALVHEAFLRIGHNRRIPF